MTILLNIISLILLSSFINLLLNISENADIMTDFDTNWIQTDCIPTYGAWGTIEGCMLKDKVSPFIQPKKCWVFMGNTLLSKNKICDIKFEQPLKSHYILTMAMVICVFKIFDIIFGGYPLLMMKCFICVSLYFPILLIYEIKFHIQQKDKFSFTRILKFLTHISVCALKEHNFLENF